MTKKEIRHFWLYQQGLLGRKKYMGKKGIMDFFSQHKIVQFDPIDICGTNHEIVLFSRINSITKDYLNELLYDESCLIEAYDKKLSIILTKDWPLLENVRKQKLSKRKKIVGVDDLKIEIMNKFSTHSIQSIDDYKDRGFIPWYWRQNASLARIAFEELFIEGKIRICQRNSGIKKYCINDKYPANHIFNTDKEYFIWHVLRRIAATGIVWNEVSPVWDYIPGLNKKNRTETLEVLLDQEMVSRIIVDDVAIPFYCLATDLKLFKKTNAKLSARLELIAPIDSFIWDRKMIKALFDFDYKWEIYIPQSRRKYSGYTLPILQDDELIGRAEIKKENNSLLVVKIWEEANKIGLNRELFEARIEDFALFNNCSKIEYL